MDHPSIADVLAHVTGAGADPEVAAHLARCADCRGLAGVGDPFGERALVELGPVDPALYGCREPLRDAQSGMGRAYRAWDRRIGREVVIKQVRSLDGVALASLHARFEREARLTARLQHPGIVAVLELGRWPDGEPFYAMPLVEGAPLDEAIAQATTPAARLALVPRLAFAAEAIAFAHDRGVVHRDLKPANILVGRFGETVVIDWGLARSLGEPGDLPTEALADDDGLTRFGVGTASYMPPEQARGAEPDRRVDVYALGATLYHVLAGVPPYGAGASAVIRARLLAGPPRPLRELAPDAAPALIAVVDKAMARDAGQRFGSALELAEELRRFATGELLRSHQYRPGERLRHWLGRHRAAVRVAVAAALVLAAVGVVAVGRIVRARDRAQAEERRAVASERAARSALASTRLAHARALVARPIDRLDALATAAEVMGELSADDPAAWQALVDVASAGPSAQALPSTIHDAIFAPTGARFATLAARSELELWDPRGRRLGGYRSTLARPRWLAWSDDGARLAIHGLDDRVEIVDADRLTARAIVVGAAGGETLVAFTGDGLLATASGDQLALWDPATGARRAGRALGCHGVTLVAVRDLVVASCGDGALVVWDRAGAARSWPVHGGLAVVTAALDGRTLYSTGDDGRALAWSVDQLEAWLAGGGAPTPRAVADRVTTRVYGVFPWPDGRSVSVAHGEVTIVGLDDGARIEDPNRSLERRSAPGAARLFGHEHGTDIIAWDPGTREVVVRLAGHRAFADAVLTGARDGRKVVAVTASEAWLWDTRLGTGAGRLPVHDGEVVAIVLDVGGARAAVVSLDGLIRTVELADGSIADARRLPSEILTAAVDAAGHLALTTADGGRPSLPLALTPAPPPVATVVTDADGRVALVAATGGARVLAERGRPVIASAVAADGGRVFTADAGGEVRVWQVASGRWWTIPDAGEGLTTALAATPDGQWLVLGHASGAVRVVALTPAALRLRLCSTLAAFGRDAGGGCELTPAAATPRR